MQHFTEIKHLIQWLIKNCPRKAVVRAMEEGSVEHLGAFTELGINHIPGWLVKVTSERGKVWLVGVTSRPEQRDFRIFVSDCYGCFRLPVPWEYWDGIEDPLDYIASDSPMPMWDGDNPIEYARLRDEQRQKIRSTDLSAEGEESGVE